MQAFKMRVQPFPSRVVLELTPLCNLACFMCPRHYIKETDGYMQPELFYKLIDEILEHKSDAVVLPFWRGESCLHPSFCELITYALERNIRIHLSTNGHFMDPAFMDVFYRCEFITFSIHTDLGYKNAKKFIDNKPEWSNVTVQISFVDTEKTTLTHLSSCTSDPSLNGFDNIRLYIEHTIGGEFGKSKYEFTVSERHFCPKLVHTIVISADGSYSRCNHIWEPESDLNLATSSILDVWNGKRFEEIRNRYPDEKCTPCDQWSGHTNGESWKRDEMGIVHKKHGIQS